MPSRPTRPSLLLLAAVAAMQLSAMPIVQACANGMAQSTIALHAAMGHSADHAAMAGHHTAPASSGDKSTNDGARLPHGPDCVFAQGCLGPAVPPASAIATPPVAGIPTPVTTTILLASIDRAPETPPPRALLLDVAPRATNRHAVTQNNSLEE